MEIESFKCCNVNLLLWMYLWGFFIFLILFVQNFFKECIRKSTTALTFSWGYLAIATPITWLDSSVTGFIYFAILYICTVWLLWVQTKSFDYKFRISNLILALILAYVMDYILAKNQVHVEKRMFVYIFLFIVLGLVIRISNSSAHEN